MVTDESRPMLPLITPRKPAGTPDRRGTRHDSLNGLFQRIPRGHSERRQFRDRRATPRVSVELECQPHVGDTRYVRLTQDLSTFGMSTRQGHTPPTGTRLVLSLFLPDEPVAPLRLTAQVLGSYDEHGGMRLRFIKPSLECVRRIHRFLRAQAAH